MSKSRRSRYEAGMIVQSRRARQTGTVVTVQRAEDDGAFDSNPWETVCEAHSTVCSHQTLALAMRFASSPLDWCEPCMAEAERFAGAWGLR